MKTECSVVRDLLPLYMEDMVNPETAEYVKSHLAECAECQAELENLKEGEGLTAIEKKPTVEAAEAKPFKTIMKRMNRQFYSIAYAALIFLIFLGFGWTAGDNLIFFTLLVIGE